jgi:hypothetical protein
VLTRLDEVLLKRLFQPMVDRMQERAAPAEAATFCLTGVMVFVLAGMLVSATKGPPGWPVLLDFANLWAAMALLRTLGVAPPGRFNALRGQLEPARRIFALFTAVVWLLGAGSLASSYGTLQCTLWCMALYFASCNPPARSGIGFC